MYIITSQVKTYSTKKKYKLWTGLKYNQKMVYLLLPMFEKLKDGEQDLQYLFMFPILSLRQKQPYEVYTKSELKARLLYTTGSLNHVKRNKKNHSGV